MPRGSGRQDYATRSLLHTLLPFNSAHARQLRTLHLLLMRDDDVVSDLHSLLPTIGQAALAALLQCGQLRSLYVPDWWLYPLPQPTPTASSPLTLALPHLQALTVVVVRGVDEAVLAVLLDAFSSSLSSASPSPPTCWCGWASVVMS